MASSQAQMWLAQWLTFAPSFAPKSIRLGKGRGLNSDGAAKQSAKIAHTLPTNYSEMES